MAADDEDHPRKKITHEIGQDLALLSVGELNERTSWVGYDPKNEKPSNASDGAV